MAKKTGAQKISAGTRIQVKDGVSSPEFPEILISGWTGTVSETVGKKDQLKYIIEWDESTISGMPENYVKMCEEQSLYHRMACLPSSEIETVES